ncbi:hypothetical protein AB1Y20_012449 [Prymnesium parvum]|uniref:N-acetyltransferase domain-containing protein n=1 Tax=Prymnesium parvum TaxID=97485 RepID=A0AB34IJI4_PRYPA
MPLGLALSQAFALAASRDLTLQPAAPADIPALMALVRAELDPAPRTRWWHERIADDDCCFVAYEECRLVGVVATKLCDSSYGLPERGHVSVCVVASRARRRGYGSQLLERALHALDAKGRGACVSLYTGCASAYTVRAPAPKPVLLSSPVKPRPSPAATIGFGRRLAPKEKTSGKAAAEAAALAAGQAAEAERKSALLAKLGHLALQHAAPRLLDAAAAWREYSPPAARLPAAPSGTDASRDLATMVELGDLPPAEKADGPLGQPYQRSLACPKFESVGRVAKPLDEEMAPLEIVKAAQLSYGAHSWCDMATMEYLRYAIRRAHALPPLRPLVLRLLARVSCVRHQGGRTAEMVLHEVQEAAAAASRELTPLLLQYRAENQLREQLGFVGLGALEKRGVVQQGTLAFFDGKYKAAIEEAGCGIDAYEDGLACMLLLASHYLAPRFAAFVARLGGGARGAAASYGARPVKTFVRMQAKVKAEYDDAEFTPPKMRHVTDTLCADLVSDCVEGQLALWGQLVEAYGAQLLAVHNTFATEDREYAGAADVNAMQEISVLLRFAPTRDGADGLAEPGVPLTFGDMLADEEGFARALREAIDSNVRPVSVQEAAHFESAAALFRTLPGLAERPLQLVTELQLHLSYYYNTRRENELTWRILRAESLLALEIDCAPYKNVPCA